MSLIVKPYTAFPGDVIRSSNYNANFDTIYNDYNGNITNANIATNAGINFSKLEGLPSAQILVGSAGGVATPRTMSGDATISNTGVVTVTGASGPFLLPAPGAPTSYRQIALVGAMGVNAVVQVHNGTSVNTYFRTDTYVETQTAINTPIALGVVDDANFGDVGSGTEITFTVGIPGRYEVIFQFSLELNGTIGGALNSRTLFRMTDGTNNKNAIEVGSTSGAITSSEFKWFPISMSEVFNFTSTGSKTVKLQKKNTVSTAVAVRLIDSSADFSAFTGKVFRVAES